MEKAHRSDWIGRLRSSIAGMCHRIVAFLMIVGSLISVCGGVAVTADSEPRQILAPGGKLRVGLYPGTPTSILLDPQLGGPRGVGYDLGKELARRLGAPYEPVIFSKNAEVLEAVKTGNVDIAFTNASPARGRDMDFGPPYLEIELGYLVPQGSMVSTLADVDTHGFRIGVTEGSSSDTTLSRDLKNAEIVRAATVKHGVDMMSAGKLDAFATNKATLYEMSDELPGSRVLAGRWGLESFAIGIPKGREAAMPFVASFVAEARAEGLVARAVQRAGLRGTLAGE